MELISRSAVIAIKLIESEVAVRGAESRIPSILSPIMVDCYTMRFPFELIEFRYPLADLLVQITLYSTPFPPW